METATYAILGLIAIPIVRALIVANQINKEANKEQKWTK